MKKIFLTLILLLSPIILYWYNSDDMISIYVDNPSSWTNIYTVPTDKDFLVKKLYQNDNSKWVSIRNWTWPTLINLDSNLDYENIDIIIKDSLYITEDPTTGSTNYTIIGVLVDEDESIESIVSWNQDGWNKEILTKQDIELIYMWEYIFCFFVMILKLFTVITRNKSPIKLF